MIYVTSGSIPQDALSALSFFQQHLGNKMSLTLKGNSLFYVLWTQGPFVQQCFPGWTNWETFEET